MDSYFLWWMTQMCNNEVNTYNHFLNLHITNTEKHFFFSSLNVPLPIFHLETNVLKKNFLNWSAKTFKMILTCMYCIFILYSVNTTSMQILWFSDDAEIREPSCYETDCLVNGLQESKARVVNHNRKSWGGT